MLRDVICGNYYVLLKIYQMILGGFHLRFCYGLLSHSDLSIRLAKLKTRK
ncbi:Uncharacterized protein NV38_0000444 [Leptospira kirschneri serovar Mozdok]|nr:Uncharacterized protein NV38_0000444 [Leptospira kirschneri serovar Mozdok]